MPHLVVGVDAGGSSTVVALEQDGNLLRTHEGPGANASSRGEEAAGDSIAATILSALDGALPHAIFVGAAGAGRPDVAQTLCSVLESRFPGSRIGVRDDAYIALRACVPEGDGAVVIAGTGSIAYAQRGNAEFRSGGYGYLLGDEGSGFSIGAAALKLVLRAFDERAPREPFVEILAARLGVEDGNAILRTIYGNRNPIAAIAAVAPIVLEHADLGDRSANKIVQAAALELSEMAKSIVKRADLAHSGAPLVLAGSLLRNNSLLTFLLESRLKNDLPEMPVFKAQAQPFSGALAAARRL